MAIPGFWSALTASHARARRLIHGAAACVLIAGCSGSAVNPDAVTTVAAEPGRAVVIGWGAAVGENLRSALTPAQDTHVTLLAVSQAGSQKISSRENVARLDPGEYDLTIACGIYVGYRYFTDDTVIHATLGAGRVYRLRAQPQGRRCQPFLEDATGGG